MVKIEEKDSNADRYSRQKKLENWNQEKLSKTTCIMAGAGALGSVVGVNLVQAGIGKLIIIDMDTIEFSNLNRQLLFTEDDVGQLKADIAKEKLLKINSNVNIESIVKKVQDIPIQIFKPSTSNERIILIDALDNFDARRWMNSISVNTNAPLISGGMYGFLGNIQVIIPHKLPCLECQPLIPEKELQKACTPPGEMRKAEFEIEEAEEFFPALGSVSSIIGGIMGQEVLKVAMDLDHLKEYLFIDTAKNNFLKIPLRIKKDCVVCSEKFKLEGIPVSFDLDETVEELKSRLSIQFNLLMKETVLIYNLKTLSNKKIQLRDVFQDANKISIYISSKSVTSPIKILLNLKSMSREKVTLIETTKEKAAKKYKKKKAKKISVKPKKKATKKSTTKSSAK